jgi:thermitase
MNRRNSDAPMHPTRALTAPLSGILIAIFQMKVRGVQGLPKGLIIAGSLALSLSLLVLLSAAGTARASVEDFEPGQVIVKLDPTVGATIETINADYGLSTLEQFPGSTGIYLLQAPSGSDTEGLVERLSNDARLLFAEPNFVAEAPENNHNRHVTARHFAWGVSDVDGSSAQDAASALGLPCAAALSLGQGSTVAVIDTGAQLDHPKLVDNFEGVARYDFVENDRNPTERPVGLDENGDGLKDEMVGHGTHVAGIVDLVAPKAKIMPLRALSTEGNGTVFTIAKAVSYAESNGADVINLSLGSSSWSRLLRDVIKDATKNGVVVAAAAGNTNTSMPHYPAAGDGTAASTDGLLGVTSVDRYQRKSDFANYGLWVDIAAPGEAIRSTFPVSIYANWSGTSMATPFISGQAALIHSLYGSLSSSGIERKIRDGARPLTLQNPTYVGMLGAGHADLCASL